jgi:hypothetical protein
MDVADLLEYTDYDAALKIQTAFRAYSARLYVKTAIERLIKSQSFVRGKFVRREVRRLHLIAQVKTAAKLQSVYRAAAIKIQSAYRVFSVVVKCSAFLIKVIICQSTARRRLAIREASKLRLALHTEAAIKMQACYRGFIARQKHQRFISHIIAVQRSFRLRVQREVKAKVLASRHAAAMKIQAEYRARAGKVHFNTCKAKLIVCQRFVRGVLARRLANMLQIAVPGSKLQAEHRQAAMKIQMTYRGHLARVGCVLFMKNVVVCQSFVRMNIATRQAARLRFIVHTKAAVKLQACSRRHMTQVKFQAIINAIIAIQRAHRKRISDRVVQAELFASHQAAAMRIQAFSRGVFAKNEYMLSLAKVVVCQSATRRKLAMKRAEVIRVTNAAIKVQSRQRDLAIAATKIQRSFRGYTMRMKYVLLAKNVVVCQSAARRMFARRQASELRCIAQWESSSKLQVTYQLAATKIQTSVRGYYARFGYVLTVKAVLVCQSAVRRMIAKRRVTKLRLIVEYEAAVKLQAAVRSYVARMKCYATIAAVIICQSAVRRKTANRKTSKLRLALHTQAAVKLQAMCRRYMERLKYIDAIIICQSVARRRFAKKRFEILQKQAHTLNDAATKIQSIVRYRIAVKMVTRKIALAMMDTAKRNDAAARREASLVARRNQAVLKLQAYFRGSLVRKVFVREQYFAIIIQKVVRRHQALKLVLAKAEDAICKRVEEAIVKLQARHRGNLVREDIYWLHYCATKFQALFRGWKVRHHHTRRLQAAAKVQSYWRSYARRKDLARQARESSAVAQSAFQRYAGRSKAATKIQAAWRSYLCCSDFALSVAEVITVQSVVRRWLVMRKMNILNITNASNDLLYCSFEEGITNTVPTSPVSPSIFSQASFSTCDGLGGAQHVPDNLNNVSLANSLREGIEVGQGSVMMDSFDIEIDNIQREIAKLQKANESLW